MKARTLSAVVGLSLWALATMATPLRGQCGPVELARRVAADGAMNDNFGIAVALHGNTVVVGAWAAAGVSPGAGAAYVLLRNGDAWTQQAKLVALDGASNDGFGVSVDVSGDTIVVGSPFAGTAGSAYVFMRSGEAWNQQAKLTASDAAANDTFGISVAIDDDTIVVGAEADDTSGGTDAGSAYVFTRSGSFWSQQAKLTAVDGAADDRFGYSVSLSEHSAIIGAQGDDISGGSNLGSAYVFNRCESVWSQQAKLTASDGAANDSFGVSVCISGDTAIVGASGDDTTAGTDAGSAYIFSRIGDTWTSSIRLMPSDATESDQFGISVAIEGDTALIGAYNDDIAGSANVGSAYVLTRNYDSCPAGWAQQAKLTATDGDALDVFGYAVAISADTGLIGAFADETTGGTHAGSAYVYGLGCDSDGDSILNANDVCPSNAPGLPVDRFGRPLRDCNGDCIFDSADIQCIVDEMLGP
ncbi:MAG: hypothetical protein DCC65_00255 [Planctomycetota bacterium]|nr:MAG: hypothetical protein DCC65_00255 [Planctomycetota bacterium]